MTIEYIHLLYDTYLAGGELGGARVRAVIVVVMVVVVMVVVAAAAAVVITTTTDGLSKRSVVVFGVAKVGLDCAAELPQDAVWLVKKCDSKKQKSCRRQVRSRNKWWRPGQSKRSCL